MDQTVQRRTHCRIRFTLYRKPVCTRCSGLFHIMTVQLLSTNERIRGRELQEIRRRFFYENPLCSGPDSECQRKGRVTIATDLDHIVTIKDGGPDVHSNRQGLCHPCHERKTAKDFGHKRKRTYGPDGWPID